MKPVLRITLLSSCVLPLLWLTALPAAAGNEQEDDDACASLCQSLDDVEEQCEAQYGDGDVFCEAIGAVEEICDPEDNDGDDDDDDDDDGTTTTDEGGDADCTDLCAGIEGADDLCDDHLGAANAICQALDDLSADCDSLGGDDGHHGGGDDDDDVCPGDDDDHGAGGGHDKAQGKHRKDNGHMMCATGPGGPATGLLLGGLLVIGLRRRQD